MVAPRGRRSQPNHPATRQPFNMTGADDNMANPDYGDQMLSMFICGDDEGAKGVVSELVASLDFEVVDRSASRHRGDGRRLEDWFCWRLPVVASAISGIPLAVEEGVTGALIPEQDGEAAL